MVVENHKDQSGPRASCAGPRVSARSGHPQQVAAAPSPGKPRARRGAGRRRPSRGAPAARAAQPHRRGIGAGGWGPGGGGAASLWAAPGRGLSAALRPLARNADSKSGGCPRPHPEPSGVPGGDGAPPPTGVQGPPPVGARPRSVGYAQLTVPSGGLSSGGARRRCAPAMECPGRRRA
uniref:collagen alpha-1(III) chain-like n=1 Tax=Odobenus rosmarus divergens TaxID=9708 RepID=UPI00063C5E63|nr:PREDICTED: collagen alpha-1(III) chain-like [Odobenus rosmarus divergens]